MGIAYGFSKATINMESYEKLLDKTKLSHEDVDEIVQLCRLSNEEEGQLWNHKLAMAANDIFQRIIETGLLLEEEKYVYYTFFANLFWFQYYPGPDEKYVLFEKNNDLDILGINIMPDRTQSRYEWLNLKFARNINTLTSIVKLGSNIDFEKLQYISTRADIGWEFSSISTFNSFKEYTMDWLNLFKQSIEEDKWLIVEFT